MMEELLQTDREALVYLNRLGDAQFDPLWLMISGTWLWVPFYLMLFYFLYKNYRINSFIFALIFIALGIAVSDQLANVFKYGVERLRPCHDPQLSPLIRKIKCGGQFGFYSAHASNSFFTATFLALLLKNKVRYLPTLLFFWAAFVSYSRIYLAAHFPSDVLVGAFMGTFIGFIFYLLMTRVLKKQKAND